MALDYDLMHVTVSHLCTRCVKFFTEQKWCTYTVHQL